MEEDEQIMHQIQLDEELDAQDSLSKFEISSFFGLWRSDFLLTDIFKFDPKYKERYKSIKAEILGEDDESGSGSDEDGSDEEEGK